MTVNSFDSPMEISYYQRKAFGFLVNPEGAYLDNGYCYPALGLTGEIGEVAEIIKKCYRDNGGILSTQDEQRLVKELGDVLWYIALLASSVDVDLGAIAAASVADLVWGEQP